MILRNSFITISLILLTACSSVLPLDYKNYEGSDAATIYIQNKKGNIGTIYITKYRYIEADACYEMDLRYELDSNILAANGNVIESKVAPNGFYAIEQIQTKETHIWNLSSSFIPDAGKYYFISPGTGVAEIPDNLKISTSTNEDEFFQKYGKNKVKGWVLKSKCKNFIGKLIN